MEKVSIDTKGIIGHNGYIGIADIGELSYLQDNARYMTNDQFMQLKSNIENDDGLTSVPLVALNKETGKYDILSGNHRVKGAEASGIKKLVVIAIDEDLSNDEKVSIQLSHNAICGKDDLQILKKLYESIQSVDMKIYSGIDAKVFDELDKLSIESLSADTQDFKTLTMVFLPEELDKIKGIIENITKLTSSKEYWVAQEKEYERLLDNISLVKTTNNIINVALAMKLIVENIERHWEDFREQVINVDESESAEDKKKQNNKAIPLFAVFDTYTVGIPTARKIERCIKDSVARGDVKANERYKVLDLIVDSYIEKISKK